MAFQRWVEMAMAPPLQRRPHLAWWNGLVGRSDGQSLMVGALHETNISMAFSETELWVVWGGRADQIELGPNETLTLDPIVIQSESDAFSLHRSYAQQVADHQSVTMAFDTPQLDGPLGYTFYEDINEEIIPR